jgi:hypothetical protein
MPVAHRKDYMSSTGSTGDVPESLTAGPERHLSPVATSATITIAAMVVELGAAYLLGANAQRVGSLALGLITAGLSLAGAASTATVPWKLSDYMKGFAAFWASWNFVAWVGMKL